MILRRHSPNYNFVADTFTGITFRWGKSIKENPLFAPWPELADISISNHCSKHCPYCYRDSKPDKSFMSVEEYEFVMNQLEDKSWGKVFQVALGGGEPTEHPSFSEIVKMTREKYGVIPNYTTNGSTIDNKIIEVTSKYCGAVAISCSVKDIVENREIFKHFQSSNVKTNIHFILSRSSLEEAARILEGVYDVYLGYINAVIFLTYKPLGRAIKKENLKFDEGLRRFLSLVSHPKTVAKIGFDACFVPLLLKYTSINKDYVDSCECGFFSVYIDEKLNVKPCSFSNNDQYAYSLRDLPFRQIWLEKFEEYRNDLLKIGRKSCSQCRTNVNCRGGCLFFPEINLCMTKFAKHS